MTITPKLHMLEDHVTEFLRTWHMGLGFYGEQGIEGIHKDYNTKSTAFQQVKNDPVRLRQLVRDHHISTNPTLAGRVPQEKKRNLKRNHSEDLDL